MKSFFRSFRNQIIFGSFVLLSAAVGWAVTIPNTFTSGTAAEAAQVNANFAALKTAVDTLEAKVAGLGTNSPLPSQSGKLGYVDFNGSGNIATDLGTTSFNSSGGAISTVRNSLGSYTVTFSGLGGDATSGGHVQITSQTFDRLCIVGLVASTAADVVINITCADSTITGGDSYASVMYIH